MSAPSITFLFIVSVYAPLLVCMEADKSKVRSRKSTITSQEFTWSDDEKEVEKDIEQKPNNFSSISNTEKSFREQCIEYMILKASFKKGDISFNDFRLLDLKGKLTNEKSGNTVVNIQHWLEIFCAELKNRHMLRGSYLHSDGVSELLKKQYRVDSLMLSSNNLFTIPSYINSLKDDLLYLDVSENKLEFLPSEISELINLKKLEVQKNMLSTLPTSIGNLKNLESLDMKDNDALTSLPKTLELLAKNKTIIFCNSKKLDNDSQKMLEKMGMRW